MAVTDKTADFWLGFCPQGPPALEPQLTRFLELDGDIVDVCDHRLPRIRAASQDVVEPDQTLEEMLEQRNTRQPGRYAGFALVASYRHHILGIKALTIAGYLGLEDKGQLDTTRESGYSNSAARIIRKGDKAWSELGAWPYALYTNGRLPASWRQDPAAAEALRSWAAAASIPQTPFASRSLGQESLGIAILPPPRATPALRAWLDALPAHDPAVISLGPMRILRLDHLDADTHLQPARRCYADPRTLIGRTQHPGRELEIRFYAAYLHTILHVDDMDVALALGYEPINGRSRSVERIRRRGEQELANLTAWPWTLFQDGKTPATWLEDEPIRQAAHDAVKQISMREYTRLASQHRRSRRATLLHHAANEPDRFRQEPYYSDEDPARR